MTRSRRRAGGSRRGKGLFPPNPSQWDNEANGLDLREALDLPLEAELKCEAAFELLPDVQVIGHGDLPVAAKHIEHLRGLGRRSWSGMGIPLPDGGACVVFNDSHPWTRTRATLMEEFFHLWLRHPTSTVRVYDQNGRLRTHDGRVEAEAYGSGAAALVPFKGLKALVERDLSAERIGRVYGVSRELVIFRAKVTRIYRRLRR